MQETDLFDSLLEEPQEPSSPVTCIGMTFENDETRGAHFAEGLYARISRPRNTARSKAWFII